jgi:hypothetical protein
LERKTICDEVFAQTNEILDDLFAVKIETITPDDEYLDNCQKCSKPLVRVYCRFEDSKIGGDFDLLVFKCHDCKIGYAYWIDDGGSDDWLGWQIDDAVHTENQPLDDVRKKQAFPKTCAKNYVKAAKTQEIKSRELNRLVEEKMADLYKANLSLTTINLAKNLTMRRIQTETSPIKIKTLLAAAIYAKANTISTDGGIWKHKGEGITERQVEKIFGVTRKTIRKHVEEFET